ncbi:MAG: hypothetical protein ACKO7R_19795 [Pseudanabaena sp.]
MLVGCDRCLNNTHRNYLFRVIQPEGIDGELCPDFADVGQELWCGFIPLLMINL